MAAAIEAHFSVLKKYDVPVPRYTSYPTVPFWDGFAPSGGDWAEKVAAAHARDRGLGLYLHLPFCESLCTYCGCNKHITRNHAVETPYLNAILKEWEMYSAHLPGRPLLRELHLGGGTPTFFSPENLRRLLEPILASVELAPGFEGSFEAHPSGTTAEHLRVLHGLGFRRVSIGVQDFDEGILKTIHRFQTAAQVERVTEDARAMGYESINFDLIYGLPGQTEAHIFANAAEVDRLRPDRIAFYSYAHVPWLKKSQRAYDESDLPTGDAKRMLYETGRDLLEADGYLEIGMDHFARPGDGLARALGEGRLHRNFMGYTSSPAALLLGLGASSISDTGDAFAQNEKTVEDYQNAVGAGRLPVIKAHFHSKEDKILRKHILNLMCRSATDWSAAGDEPPGLPEILDRLREPERDGLVDILPKGVRVTDGGRAFLRNICLAFDARFWAKRPTGELFSRAV